MPHQQNIATTREHITHACESTYLGYLLLNLCTNNDYTNRKKGFKFKVNKGENHFGHFKDLVIHTIKENEKKESADDQHERKKRIVLEKKFSLNKKNHTLKLTKKEIDTPNDTLISTPINQYWQVEISSENSTQKNIASQKIKVKALNEYTPEEFIQLTQNHSLTIFEEKNTGDYKFATNIVMNNKNIPIGGLDEKGNGKIELYPLHLNNLYNIFKSLHSKKQNLNMLVAMATGSGKSYTQALWFLILYLAGYSAAFAVPEGYLITQLTKDFCKLLPKQVTSHLQVSKQVTSHLQENIRFPSDDDAQPCYCITTHKELLMNSWAKLYKETSDKKEKLFFLSIDEEHKAMQIELFKKRIQLLSKTMPMMLLSATPSEIAYKICGNKPIASLSKKQATKMGISQEATSFETNATPIKIKTRSLFKKIIATFVDVIEQPKVSSAHEYINQSEIAIDFRKKQNLFYLNPQDQENQISSKQTEEERDQKLHRLLQWNVQDAISKKTLILTDSHDVMVNINNIISNDGNDNDMADPYGKGNRVERRNIYEFFNLGKNLDKIHLENQKKWKQDFRKQNFAFYIKEAYPHLTKKEIDSFIEENIDFSETNAYCEYRVLHGLIENTLECLTGLDRKNLDHERFYNPTGLTQQIDEKINCFISQEGRLNTKIDRLIKEYLENKNIFSDDTIYIIQLTMRRVIDILLEAKNNDKDQYERIINNWGLDKKMHTLLNDDSNQMIKSFAKNFKTLFLMKGLSKTETRVSDDNAFFKLIQKEHWLEDYDWSENPALKRPLSILETLNPMATQKTYEPKFEGDEFHLKLEKKEVIKLFQMDLIGELITSSHLGTGFNDPNLNQVAMLFDSNNNELNTPDNIIQGYGRNRGLNPFKKPWFFIIGEKKNPVAFSPKKLKKENYFPNLFKARSTTQEKSFRRLGEKIAKEIQSWIEISLDPQGTIDPVALQNKCEEILIHEFDVIHQAKNHNFKKAKKEFCKVLEDSYHALYMNIKKLNKSNELSFFARTVAIVLNRLSHLWYRLKTRSSRKSFIDASNKLINSNDQCALTYAHIIQTYNYQKITKHSLAGNRLISIINTHTERALNYFKKNFLNFDLSLPESLECLNSKNLTIIRKNKKVRNFLSKSIERFVASDLYLKWVKAIIAPLSDQHLETILHARYPDEINKDTNNKEKISRIIEFYNDLNNQMSGEELLEKYGETLSEIQSWISNIYEEILDSLCYYQATSIKGNPIALNELNAPELKSKNPTHSIWALHDRNRDDDHQPNETDLIDVAKQNQFLMATIDAFDPLNKIEQLNATHTQRTLAEVAQHVIKPIKKIIAKKTAKNNTDENVDRSNEKNAQSIKRWSKEFGKFFLQHKPLTPKEIESPSTRILSSVKKIKVKIEENQKNRRQLII